MDTVKKDVPGNVKSLHNSCSNTAKKNVPDIKTFGKSDLFVLISKASSEKEGWMKSTKAMEIEGTGCVIQVTTQQRNADGSYALAEALTFVPGAKIAETEPEKRTLTSGAIRKKF